MKKSTLALAFGAGLATAIMGTISPASALTFSGTGGTGSLANQFPNTIVTAGNFTAPPGAFPSLYIDTTFTLGSTTAADYQYDAFGFFASTATNNTGNPNRPWTYFVIEHPNLVILTVNNPTGSTVTQTAGKITFKLNPQITSGNVGFSFGFTAPSSGTSFTIRQYATPEPLTILGTGVVLGAIPALKKEYARRVKKKSVNA